MLFISVGIMSFEEVCYDVDVGESITNAGTGGWGPQHFMFRCEFPCTLCCIYLGAMWWAPRPTRPGPPRPSQFNSSISWHAFDHYVCATICLVTRVPFKINSSLLRLTTSMQRHSTAMVRVSSFNFRIAKDILINSGGHMAMLAILSAFFCSTAPLAAWSELRVQ